MRCSDGENAQLPTVRKSMSLMSSVPSASRMHLSTQSWIAGSARVCQVNVRKDKESPPTDMVMANCSQARRGVLVNTIKVGC
jgi:hypothetical protein